MLAFSSNGPKDSATFAGEVARVRLEPRHLGAARGDERDLGAAAARGQRVRAGGADDGPVAARLAAARRRQSPARWSARWSIAVELTDVDGHPADQFLVIGQVVGVHLDESAIIDGAVDTRRLRPVARCGGPGDYAVVESTFVMLRPVS